MGPEVLGAPGRPQWREKRTTRNGKSQQFKIVVITSTSNVPETESEERKARTLGDTKSWKMHGFRKRRKWPSDDRTSFSGEGAGGGMVWGKSKWGSGEGRAGGADTGKKRWPQRLEAREKKQGWSNNAHNHEPADQKKHSYAIASQETTKPLGVTSPGGGGRLNHPGTTV